MNAAPDYFSLLAAAGFAGRLIPICPPDARVRADSVLVNGRDNRGKAPGRLEGGLWDAFKGWRTIAAGEAELAAWRGWGAGVGIRCDDGLIAIDADALDVGHAALIKAAIHARWPSAPSRVGQAPKELYLLRAAIDRKITLKFGGAGNRIEVLTNGQQFVACGIHQKTGQPYRWSARPTFDELPIATAAEIEDFIAEMKAALPEAEIIAGGTQGEAPDQATLVGKYEDIAAAVAATPNDKHFDDRSPWITMMHAIKAALGMEGLEIVLGFSSRWMNGENDPDQVEKEFTDLKGPFRVGASWVFDQARRATGLRFDARQWWEKPERSKPQKNTVDIQPYHHPDPRLIAPRASLYGGHYVRRFVSATVAPSKVGKSSLIVVEALAMTSGRALVGPQPAGQFRVWWWNGEDPHDELERRIEAAKKFYSLTEADIGDRLMVTSGREMPINITRTLRGTAYLDDKQIDKLRASLLENRIDVAIFDPFVSMHRATEIDNNAMDLVTKACGGLAEDANCAVELVHHTRKLNGATASAEDSRGASAIIGTTRAIRALTKMTADQAQKRGFAKEYKTLFRFSEDLTNLYAPSPDDDDRWMRIASVNLENGEGEDMADKIAKGDRIGVATPFDAAERRQDALEAAGVGENAGEAGLSREERALQAVRSHAWRKDARSPEWVGIPIAQALEIDRDSPEGKAQVANIIREWLAQGKLREENRMTKARQMKQFIVAPETPRHSAEAFF